MATPADQPMPNGTTPAPDPDSQAEAAQFQADRRVVLANAVSQLLQQHPQGGFKTFEVEVKSVNQTAAAAALRVKMRVATEEEEERKAKKEFVDKMRGWMMTVLALLASMAMEAALHPPEWLPTKGLHIHGHRAAGRDVAAPVRVSYYFIFAGAAFLYSTAAIPMMLSSSRIAEGYQLLMVKIAAVGSVFLVGVVFALGVTSRTDIIVCCCVAQIVLALYFAVKP